MSYDAMLANEVCYHDHLTRLDYFRALLSGELFQSDLYNNK